MHYDPFFLWPENNLAWLFATCPEPSCRNGLKAIEFAKRACDRSDWHCWSFISTLAAAYAEVGDFEKAVSFQKVAIAMAPSETASQEQQVLQHYIAKQPWRTH